MRPLGCAQGLNGLDALAQRRADGCDAGAHRRAIDAHGAGTAGGHTAAEFGSGQVQHVAQHPKQGHRGVDFQGNRLSIKVEFHAGTGVN